MSSNRNYPGTHLGKYKASLRRRFDHWQAWLSGILHANNRKGNHYIQHAEGLDPSVDQKLLDQGYKYQLGPHKLSTIKRRLAIFICFLGQRQMAKPLSKQRNQASAP